MSGAGWGAVRDVRAMTETAYALAALLYLVAGLLACRPLVGPTPGRATPWLLGAGTVIHAAGFVALHRGNHDDLGSVAGSLVHQIDAGVLEIATEVDGGTEQARAALPFLQGFLAQGRGLDIDFE